MCFFTFRASIATPGRKDGGTPYTPRRPATFGL